VVVHSNNTKYLFLTILSLNNLASDESEIDLDLVKDLRLKERVLFAKLEFIH